MARKNIKKGLSTLLVTVSLLSLVGCGGQKTLDGHYTVDTPTYNFPKTLNFESDGDCDYNDTLGITYKNRGRAPPLLSRRYFRGLRFL